MKEWLKKKTRGNRIYDPTENFQDSLFSPSFLRIFCVFHLCMQMFAALLWISEYLPEATVQPFAEKLKVLRFASDHSRVQEYFKTNYSCKIRKKLDTSNSTFGGCKIRLLW